MLEFIHISTKVRNINDSQQPSSFFLLKTYKEVLKTKPFLFTAQLFLHINYP